MGKYVWKGTTQKATVYDFEVDGEKIIVSSNAANYLDAITAAGLPSNAKLLSSISFPIYNGKKNKDAYTDIIWAMKGCLPSGKSAAAYLVENGVLTREEASAIYDAPEVRL
jgi:hypothetical protein